MILKALQRGFRRKHDTVESPEAKPAVDAGFELTFFRPQSEMASPPYGITSSRCDNIQDAELVGRLLAAYRLARTEHAGCGNSMWQSFFNDKQTRLDEAFLAGPADEATRLLRDPASSDHFYGFDNLCTTLLPPALQPSVQQGAALACLAGLIRVAEALGVIGVWNPEQIVPWGQHCWTADEVLTALEDRLGIAIPFPNPYPNEVGLRTSRGICSYRAVQALYQAWRIRELVSGIPHARVLEIGAGLGRTAFYARLLGIKHYTLVDIPLSMIAQGYFLGRCLGPAELTLFGEQAAAMGTGIHFLSPKHFLDTHDRYDLIVNVDSLTEMAPEVSRAYLERIAICSPLLLSINHETNRETVHGMLKPLHNVLNAQRSLYWLRRGYVEEVVRFKPET